MRKKPRALIVLIYISKFFYNIEKYYTNMYRQLIFFDQGGVKFYNILVYPYSKMSSFAYIVMFLIIVCLLDFYRFPWIFVIGA